MSNNFDEISIITKLVNQQIALLDSLADCNSSKKELIKQANKLLKSVAIYHGGSLFLNKDFLDSAEDSDVELNIIQDKEGSVELKIKDSNNEE
jgi:hypothetical protein